MKADLELICDVIAEQAPVLVVVGGVVYDAHLTQCVAGELVAVARPLGVPTARREYRWRLAEIADLGPREEPDAVNEPPDPLQEQSARLVAQAREYSGLSLAERLLEAKQGGHHHDRTDASEDASGPSAA